MKRISLQWRITLLTSLLIFLSCLTMNFLSYGSGLYYMDALIDFFTQNKDASAPAEYQLPLESDIPIFSAQKPDGDFIMDISVEPGIFENQQNITIAVTTVQEHYRITNWCITAAVSLCSGAIAYFVSGRALVPLANKKNITLEYEGDAKMIGSDTLIFRLIFNLAENAIKYNRQDGFVKLSVLQDGDLIRLRIRDTGFGIPKEMQNNIFEPFFRVDKSRSRSLGGAGLGLSMVYEIAKLHSGSICVEESSSAGTVFLVLLPSI